MAGLRNAFHDNRDIATRRLQRFVPRKGVVEYKIFCPRRGRGHALRIQHERRFFFKHLNRQASIPI